MIPSINPSSEQIIKIKRNHFRLFNGCLYFKTTRGETTNDWKLLWPFALLWGAEALWIWETLTSNWQRCLDSTSAACILAYLPCFQCIHAFSSETFGASFMLLLPPAAKRSKLSNGFTMFDNVWRFQAVKLYCNQSRVIPGIQYWDPLMVSFPYYSHTISLGILMGVVWE